MVKRGSCHDRALSTGYSVLTWNSTFHRRSEFMCFIHSSSVPSSVTTELICTGTACPAGKVGEWRQIDFEQAAVLPAHVRHQAGSVLVGRRYGLPTRRIGIRRDAR